MQICEGKCVVAVILHYFGAYNIQMNYELTIAEVPFSGNTLQ